MSRILFVVPPLAGHTNPTVSVGRTLQARGHDVAWTGHPDVVRELIPADCEFLPVDEAVPQTVRDAVAHQPERGLQGPASLKFLWEEFLLPLGESMVPGVHDAVDVFGPDVLVVDQQAVAGAAVTMCRGIPWVTSATTSAEIIDPLSTMPKVDDWVRQLLADFLRSAGVAESAAGALDPRFSPHLVLVFSTEALVGNLSGFPDHYAFVGPSISDRADDTPFDWEWLDPDRPLVLVTLGTLNWAVGTRFFGVAAQALAEMDVQAVMVGAPPELATVDLRVASRVPQLPLLARTSAVVSHGGHNTVCEALAHGIPLVVAPIRDDQPIVAQQVVAAQAGVRVKFGRAQPGQLRKAVESALYDPILRSGAERVRSSFILAGGPGAAADRLAALLPRSAHVVGSEVEL